MLTDLSPAAPGATGGDTHGRAEFRRRLRWHHPDRADLIAGAVYLLGAVWVNIHLLRHPSQRVQAHNIADDAGFQWMLAHGARVVTHGVNPFFTYQMNVPDGVNLMSNTAVLGLTLPLAPVTLLMGTGVAYAMLVMFALTGTATAWYYVLSRHVVTSRAAAVLGGLFAGFAPGMVSQVDGHPNIAAQFLVPFLIWRTIRLREPGRSVRNGIVLGLLVVWQTFINEEILLITAICLGLFVGCHALGDRRTFAAAVRPGLRGLAMTALVAGVLLAYPLYWQFTGPRSYLGLPMSIQKNFGADISSFTAFASQSLGGSRYTIDHYAQNASEENSFLGWPLVALLIALVWWLRRRPAVRAMAFVGVVAGVLSLGPRLYVRGRHSHIPLPYALLDRLPIFDTVVTTRFALVLTPIAGILLALGYQRMSDLRRSVTVPAEVPAWLVSGALLVGALLPLVPRPLPTVNAPLTPKFVSSGEWRRYVPAGHSVVTVPSASSRNPQGMFWSASTGLELPLQAGYFLGPAGSGSKKQERRAIFGPPKRPTPVLWEKVATSGDVPKITAKDRTNARADLRYWRAAVVLLPRSTHHASALRTTTTKLLGAQPTLVDGVWLWDVRAHTRD